MLTTLCSCGCVAAGHVFKCPFTFMSVFWLSPAKALMSIYTGTHKDTQFYSLQFSTGYFLWKFMTILNFALGRTAPCRLCKGAVVVLYMSSTTMNFYVQKNRIGECVCICVCAGPLFVLCNSASNSAWLMQPKEQSSNKGCVCVLCTCDNELLLGDFLEFAANAVLRCCHKFQGRLMQTSLKFLLMHIIWLPVMSFFYKKPLQFCCCCCCLTAQSQINLWQITHERINEKPAWQGERKRETHRHKEKANKTH